MQSQERVKGVLMRPGILSVLEVKDTSSLTYGQFPDLIGYRLFLRYLFHMYVLMLACALHEFYSPAVRYQDTIRCAHSSSKPLERGWT